jgi:predicted site-specific integrase-resolvase
MKRVFEDDTRKYLLRTIIDCEFAPLKKGDSETIVDLSFEDDEELVYDLCEIAHNLSRKLNELINLRQQQ